MANYILIQRMELTQSAASVTFSNIPQSGYTDLKVVVSARGTTSNINDLMKIQFNGSTANFTTRWIQGNSSTASSGNDTTGRIGYMPDAASTASTFGNAEIYIPNYLGSTNKSYSTDAVQENNSGTAGQALVNLFAGLWSQTTAISSITLTGTNGNFAANSTFSLYGIAATGTTPTTPKAVGGDIVVNDGTYWYHAFLASGTFTPTETLSCDYLVIAGGGGGGNYAGGGGGAGGFRASTNNSLTATNYTVTVGAGGAGGNSLTGTSGNSSSINAFISAGGGGGGGSTFGTSGLAGGSGGGASGSLAGGFNGSGGAASPSGQGNAGGSTSGGDASGYGAAGGGGAGAVGQSNTGSLTTNGGAGGAGLNTYSTWASATGTGVSGYYAGGGGGSPRSGAGTGGTGGAGGGSNGGGSSSSNATANTGSGGGGVWTPATNVTGSGGSGIIIVRYAV